MIWQYPKEPEASFFHEQEQILFPESSIHPITKELIIARGIHSEADVQSYLFPKWTDGHAPILMKNMDKAALRLSDAIQKKEKIFVYGDYDVDGTTSVSLFSCCLENWDVPHSYYIPEREKEGYGLSYMGIDLAYAEGYSLMVALDCGTKEYEKVKYAKSKGIDLIICDHHTPGSELPDCYAFLNPKQEDCNYPFKELSACGVGFKLLEEVSKRLGIPLRPDGCTEIFYKYGDLVALSIACDIVPIVGENRLFAFKGLEKIKNEPSEGIASLMALSETQREWNISDLVFFLGPRINSAGRLGSARRAVEVLKGKDKYLTDIALALHNLNEERQKTDKLITAEALKLIEVEQIENELFCHVLFNENWHKGVIGIVASRVIEHYYRPTIMLTQSNGKWVGSGRSIEGFDLYEAVLACSDYVDQFGGHKHAIGLTISLDKLSLFKQNFNTISKELVSTEMMTPKLKIDRKIDFKSLNFKLLDSIRRMEPFGPGNLEPVFATQKAKVVDANVLKEQHLKLTLEKEGKQFKAIGFGLGQKWLDLKSPQFLDVAYHFNSQKWKNNEILQLSLKDIKNSD